MTSVTVIFGKEQVLKTLNNLALDENERRSYQKTYHFESSVEAKAFEKGIYEAVGWQEVYVMNKQEEMI